MKTAAFFCLYRSDYCIVNKTWTGQTRMQDMASLIISFSGKTELSPCTNYRHSLWYEKALFEGMRGEYKLKSIHHTMYMCKFHVTDPGSSCGQQNCNQNHGVKLTVCVTGSVCNWQCV